MIQQHPTEVEINGLFFPVHQALILQNGLQQLLEQRQELTQAEGQQQGWLDWCQAHGEMTESALQDLSQKMMGIRQHAWKGTAKIDGEIDALIETLTRGKALLQAHSSAQENIDRIQAHIHQIVSDPTIQKLNVEQLSLAELKTAIIDLSREMDINPADVYGAYVNDPDGVIQQRAKAVLMLNEQLSQIGVFLRWPAPPLTDSFVNQLQAEFEFQLRWSIQLMELEGQLSLAECHALSMPESPFTEEKVTRYIEAHKKQVASRSFWNTLVSGFKRKGIDTLRTQLLQKYLDTPWTQLLSLMMECQRVPKGSFRMGAGANIKKADADEYPQHRVTLSHDLLVMIHPVTNELYASIIDIQSSFEAKFPIVNISWLEAVQFANALSQRHGLQAAYTMTGNTVHCHFDAEGWRLPTEAEWEYCARANRTDRAIEAAVDAEVWYRPNSRGGLHPVCQKKANPFGLFELCGHVREWCWDWYDEKAYSTFATTDPTGPTAGTNRVVRGGSYSSVAKYIRVSARDYDMPTQKSSLLGFRLVRRAQID